MKQIGPLLKLIRVIISQIWQANHRLFSHTRQRKRERQTVQTIIHLQHSDVWKWHSNYSILAWRMGRLISHLFCTVIFATRLTTFKIASQGGPCWIPLQMEVVAVNRPTNNHSLITRSSLERLKKKKRDVKTPRLMVCQEMSIDTHTHANTHSHTFLPTFVEQPNTHC